MKSTIRPTRWFGLLVSSLVAAFGSQVASAADAAGDKQVYRCPGNLYTDSLSAKEANAKGCKTLEGAPITVIQSQVRREGKETKSSGPKESKVDPGDQRNRDSDARRILEDELKKAQEALAALKKEYNNGEPERKGDEKNYQKYVERVAELKASITRQEADVEALKRELSKLPAAASAP